MSSLLSLSGSTTCQAPMLSVRQGLRFVALSDIQKLQASCCTRLAWAGQHCYCHDVDNIFVVVRLS